MYCFNCGEKFNPDTDKFCSKCGVSFYLSPPKMKRQSSAILYTTIAFVVMIC